MSSPLALIISNETTSFRSGLELLERNSNLAVIVWKHCLVSLSRSFGLSLISNEWYVAGVFDLNFMYYFVYSRILNSHPLKWLPSPLMKNLSSLPSIHIICPVLQLEEPIYHIFIQNVDSLINKVGLHVEFLGHPHAKVWYIVNHLWFCLQLTHSMGLV